MNRLNLLTCSALTICAVSISVAACAQDTREFRIPPGSLRDALNLFATQSDQQIFFRGELVAGLRTAGVTGRRPPSAALDALLAGTGLTWSETRPGVIVVARTDAMGVTSETEVKVEDVVVTGTLLRSAGAVASPVVTLDRDALDRRGFGTVAEAVTDLPQNYAGTATPVVQLAGSDRGGSNTVYATGVNLRGLGPTSTLVLVNGRRLAGTGFRGEFADVSALPSAAVDRVDVLLDGASALYGADAVAGVVNVIMKPSFDGQETRLRASAAAGGAEDLMVSHLIGRTWSSGSAYLSYERQDTNGLSSRDRAYTADGDLRPFGGTDHRNLYTSPGNILAFDAATASYVSQYAIRPGAGGVARTPADFVAGAANRQSMTLGADLIPSIARDSVYGRIRQNLGDRFEVTADVRYNKREYDITGAPSIGIFTLRPANPFFVSPNGATSYLVGYSFAQDSGPLKLQGSSESLGASIGARFALTETWSLEGYVGLAEEHGSLGVYNRINSRFLNEALGNLADDPLTPYSAARDGYFNIYGSGGANSATVVDFISSGFSTASDRSRATSANLVAEGPVMALPGGEVQVAVGAQIRTETFNTETYSLGSTVAPVLTVRPERERTVKAVFAEARIPLVGPGNARPGLESLTLSIAGRHEAYDDAGTTTNPKVGVVWSPRSGLNVRASWGTSFRAASLPQTFDSSTVGATFLDRADGTRALGLFLNGGNSSLKPETAETFTAGVDFRPLNGGLLSAGYFDTRFEDRIAQPVSENLDGVLRDPALTPFVRYISPSTNAADLALIQSYTSTPGFPSLYPVETYAAIIDSRWVNTGSVRVRGFDVNASWPFELGEGEITADASGSYLLDYETRPTPTAPVRQVVGLLGYPVRFRARAGVSWRSGAFGLSAHANHVDDYKDRAGVRIAAWTTVDAQASWTPDAARWEGLRVNLTVQNLLNEDPPFYDAPSGYGFDPGQGNLLGRVVSLQLIQRW